MSDETVSIETDPWVAEALRHGWVPRIDQPRRSNTATWILGGLLVLVVVVVCVISIAIAIRANDVAHDSERNFQAVHEQERITACTVNRLGVFASGLTRFGDTTLSDAERQQARVDARDAADQMRTLGEHPERVDEICPGL